MKLEESSRIGASILLSW